MKRRSHIATRAGAPRLVVDGRETAALLGWSWDLVKAAPIYRRAGIRLLHPILNLGAMARPDGSVDVSLHDQFFAELLDVHPEALFLPRVLTDPPAWWLDAHPEELTVPARPVEGAGKAQFEAVRFNEQGHWTWTNPTRAPSFASEVWKDLVRRLLEAWLTHVERGSLSEHVIGYQIGAGVYGEWHYPLMDFVPDYSAPAQRVLGPPPSLDRRQQAGPHGFFHDDLELADYYRRFHRELVAGTLLGFAGHIKQLTECRVIVGAFYGYHLETVCAHEGGHFAADLVLKSPDIDFLASPLSYMTTNDAAAERWTHDVYDEAEPPNRLGRTRGLAGDGGYRVLLESCRRHGKLYIAEMDAGTYLDPAIPTPDDPADDPIEVLLRGIGGVGSNEPWGSRQILRRDWGRQWASGAGGWVFDFGPALPKRESWYASEDLEALLAEFVELNEHREALDLSSVAEIAAVYGSEYVFRTPHWSSQPRVRGGVNLDPVMRWFAGGQLRALHRIGAPVDTLYDFDLQPEDFRRYRLIFVPAKFVWTEAEIDQWHGALAGSGCTVVWTYAPGYLTPAGRSLDAFRRLTGFAVERLDKPAPWLIDTGTMTFGLREPRSPRFTVDGESLGQWADGAGPAIARKTMDGWTSVYVGAPPMPVPVLRGLAEAAGVTLWSSKPDVVVATRDTAMLCATSAGSRTVRGERVEMREGEVLLWGPTPPGVRPPLEK